MSTFKPSKYQEAILEVLQYQNTNILVDAKAGSGKTSTLILMAEELEKQNKSCLFLAFNKSIVEELQTKINSDKCEIRTLHSLGLSFIKSYLFKKHGKDYKLEICKKDEYVKERVKELFNEYCLNDFMISEEIADLSEDRVKSKMHDIIREIAQMVNYCRLYNINYHDKDNVLELGGNLCWDLPHYNNFNLENYPIIIEEVINSIKYNFENPTIINGIPCYKISYTDMIYLPCVYNMFPPASIRPYLDTIMADECQDLSVLQQIFLKRLNGVGTRYIFVGDEKQSIYGFAGADTKSIKNLKRNFNLVDLPLNICYRCPKNVIKLAQQIVPSIDWNHTREDEGLVKFIEEKKLKDLVKPNDVIIGRRNKDLLYIFKQFTLYYKIPIKFKNEEMVLNIVTEFSRSIDEYIRRYVQCLNIQKEIYEICSTNEIDADIDNVLSKKQEAFVNKTIKEVTVNRKMIKKRSKRIYYDIAFLKDSMEEFKAQGGYKYHITKEDELFSENFDVIYDFLEMYLEKHKSNTLVEDFEEYVEIFLKANFDKDTPILSSIHKMKGGEADNIFILDYPRFPYKNSYQTEDTQQQEENLQYVALTRAKKNLYLCKIERTRPTETEEDIIEKNNLCETKFKTIMRD